MTSDTIQIFLNSKTASSYINGYTSNCNFNLVPIIIPKTATINFSLQSASIPYSFYNVDYFNDILNYTLNGTTYNIRIPQGNYNVTNLANYLSSVMNGFTITYSQLNNGYTFVHSTYDFSFLSSSTCMEILGFNEKVNISSNNKSLSSTNSINLFTIRNIYIQSDNIVTNNINNATVNSKSILASIPIQSGQNSIINFYNIINVKSRINDIRNFSVLNIKLTDQDGDILDLNGCHWSCVLQLDIHY